MPEQPGHVIKVGGSLLDMADLPRRLRTFVALEQEAAPLILVGGGRAADLVRAWDRAHHIGEVASHTLAVRAMSLNAHLLDAALPDGALVRDPAAWRNMRDSMRFAIVEPLDWLEDASARGVSIAERWSFTSDSIAAAIAVQVKASRLTLLKSVSPQADVDVAAASRDGLIDADFPAASRGIARVDVVNLRRDPPTTHALREP